MFEDIIPDQDIEFGPTIRCCEDCDIASYILSNFSGKVLCQRTGHHMLYSDWCEKWEQRERVKPN